MRKDEIITLEITDLNNLGYGIGHAGDGRVVFVPGGVTGDTVSAKIIKVNAKYCVSRLESVIKPSHMRSENEFCASPESCGGCVYRHIDYEYELRFKREYVKNEFIKAGLRDVNVTDVQTTGITKGYRNKAQYPVAEKNGKMIYGFYAAKTHNIVGKSCPLQPEIFDGIAAFICDYCNNNGIRAYNEKDASGILRHIFIREAKGSGQIMVCLVLRRECSGLDERFALMLKEKFSRTVSIMLNYNRRETNVVTGNEYRVLYGNEYIEDELLGLRFRIKPASFWQVNHDAAELLYSQAAKAAGLTGNETLLDLYCGTGSIGLTMAKHAKRLIGIEIEPSAVECANVNAKLNRIENAEFYCADAKDAEGVIASAEKNGKPFNADVAVIDPPRKGTTNELIGYINQRNIKKVVYVSCSPDTLARDCAEFVKHGYRIEGDIVPVDMFPRTGHVETVCLLTKDTEYN